MLVDPWGPIATYIPTSRTTSILSSLWWGSSCWLWPSWLTSKFPPPRLVLSPIGIGLCPQTFTKSPQDLHQYNPFMMIMMLIMMMILQILSGPASIQFSQTTPWNSEQFTQTHNSHFPLLFQDNWKTIANFLCLDWRKSFVRWKSNLIPC